MTDESQVVVEQPEVATAESATPVKDETTAVPETKPERTFTQAELDEIVEKRLAKEKRKQQDLRKEADLFKRLAIERGEQPRQQPQQITQETNPKPQLESFKDYTEYVEALADWKAEQRYSEMESKRNQQEASRRQVEFASQLRNTHAERETKARGKFEDYDEVTRNPSLPVSEAMANTIMLSDNGPDLFYYLGSNPDEAARIHSMPPLLAVKELGKIEAKLASTPNSKPVTKAPDPISPVGGKGGSPTSNDPMDTDDIDTWRRKREAQIRRRLTGK